MAKSLSSSANVERIHPLAGKNIGVAGVTLSAAPAAYRCNLRAGSRALTSLSKALGVPLPKAPKSSATAGSRSALWLGPDEWLILDEKKDPTADLATVKALHSAVDISHRNTAIIVSGEHAADIINAGCPQDLSLAAFPIGACSRTILGKAEIVLFRAKKHEFRVEVWRSFSAYAFELLSTAAKSG